MSTNLLPTTDEIEKIISKTLELDVTLKTIGNSIANSLEKPIISAGANCAEAIAAIGNDADLIDGIMSKLSGTMSSVWDTGGALAFSDVISGVASSVDEMKDKINESGTAFIDYAKNIDTASIGTWAQKQATDALNTAENFLNSLVAENSESWLIDSGNMAIDTAASWLQEEASNALAGVKDTLNGVIDNSIGKLLEESTFFGEGEQAIFLQEKAIEGLNAAKDALNGLIDNTIGGLIDEGTNLATNTAKTWLREAAEKALSFAKGVLNSLMDSSVVMWLKETAATVANTVAKGAQSAITGIVTAAQGALNFIMSMNPMTLIVIAIAALVAAFVLLWNKCEGFRNFFMGLWDTLKSVGAWIANTFTGIFNGVANAVSSMVNSVVSKLKSLVNLVIRPINVLISGLNLVPGVNIPKIPLLAEGGFVSTGQMFIAREAGPELVGTIGSRSAVANNDQIVESVSRGVFDAVRAALGGGLGGNTPLEVKLYLDGKQITAAVERVQKERGLTLLSGGLAYVH